MIFRPDAPDRYAVYALQYGRRDGVRGEHFLGWDATSAQPHDTAYYAWLALSSDHTVLIDSGIAPDAELPLAGWQFRTSIPELLPTIGLTTDDIDTLVLTHLHYDHAGGLRWFPRARVYLQAAELAYWTGPEAKRVSRETWLADPRDLATAAHAEQLTGDAVLAPGLSVHVVGGHTAGMQIVRLETPGGPLVLASDAGHFFENLETDRPGTILHHMPDVYTAFDRARELAGDGPVVPGHDPEVMTRLGTPVTGSVARLA